MGADSPPKKLRDHRFRRATSYLARTWQGGGDTIPAMFDEFGGPGGIRTLDLFHAMEARPIGYEYPY
jgi:hypothetical protein